jgi:Flp pilus assembly protein TadD
MSDERLWREAVAASPDKVRPKVQLARNVAPAEALSLLADARRIAPNDPTVATETGKTLLGMGNAAAALSEFGRALALDPRNPEYYNNRGVALAALGQRDAARQDFEHALQIAPDLMGARQNLIRLEQ